MNTNTQAPLNCIGRLWPTRPVAGIILGTGMGRIAGKIDIEAEIDYENLPHFPSSTALGHRGRLLCGTLASVPIVAMDGRPHVYEGNPLSAIATPVRVFKALGAELLVLSNASGGLNPQFASGDLMVIDDHINLMFGSPLAGPSIRDPESRLLGMGRPYDPRLIDRALAVARRENFVAHRGVYVAMTGPNYETRAEYRFLRRIGADVVGMSTVPEAIVAADCGLRVFAVSTVTNIARPDAPEVIQAEDVLHDAEAAAPNVGKMVEGVLRFVAKFA